MAQGMQQLYEDAAKGTQLGHGHGAAACRCRRGLGMQRGIKMEQAQSVQQGRGDIAEASLCSGGGIDMQKRHETVTVSQRCRASISTVATVTMDATTVHDLFSVGAH